MCTIYIRIYIFSYRTPMHQVHAAAHCHKQTACGYHPYFILFSTLVHKSSPENDASAFSVSIISGTADPKRDDGEVACLPTTC